MSVSQTVLAKSPSVGFSHQNKFEMDICKKVDIFKTGIFSKKVDILEQWMF